MEILEYGDQRMYEFLPGVHGRVLLDGRYMTFFLVEIPYGKKVPIHHHPHEQLGICLAGAAEFVSKNQKRMVKKGMVYRFELNEEHEVNVIGAENGLFLDVFSPPRSETMSVRAGVKPRAYHGNLGISIHEFRDVGRSHLQLAKKDGLDTVCVEFWMGHKIDPLGYNKFTELSPDYVLDNYKIAEKHLNIISGHQELTESLKVVDDRLKEKDKEIAELKEQVEKQKPDLDKYFEENIEEIIKKFNKYGVDMKIRNNKRR